VCFRGLSPLRWFRVFTITRVFSDLTAKQLENNTRICRELLRLADVLEPGMTRFRGLLLFYLVRGLKRSKRIDNRRVGGTHSINGGGSATGRIPSFRNSNSLDERGFATRKPSSTRQTEPRKRVNRTRCFCFFYRPDLARKPASRPLCKRRTRMLHCERYVFRNTSKRSKTTRQKQRPF